MAGCRCRHMIATPRFQLFLRRLPMRRFIPLLLVSLGLLAACSKVNLENYNRLKTGQSYDEVVAVIGAPTRCDEMLGVRQCVWGDEQRNIKIGFVAGKALTMAANNLK
jgi:hypothetical protein